MFSTRSDYVDVFVLVLRSMKKERKRRSPGRVNMQSAHASACFVRIGRCCLGSIFGSILESFREPSSPLYSFLVALVARTGLQKSHDSSMIFWLIFKSSWGGATGVEEARGPGKTFLFDNDVLV